MSCVASPWPSVLGLKTLACWCWYAQQSGNSDTFINFCSRERHLQSKICRFFCKFFWFYSGFIFRRLFPIYSTRKICSTNTQLCSDLWLRPTPETRLTARNCDRNFPLGKFLFDGFLLIFWSVRHNSCYAVTDRGKQTVKENWKNSIKEKDTIKLTTYSYN